MSSPRWTIALAITAIAILSGRAEGQVRQFTAPLKRQEDLPKIPKAHMPPAGMCRIWIDNVPPAQQPAPTDCASAIRNRPSNGRVIFGSEDVEKGKGKAGKDAKEERGREKKKPDSDGARPS
jgi:hypothetical protein